MSVLNLLVTIQRRGGVGVWNNESEIARVWTFQEKKAHRVAYMVAHKVTYDKIQRAYENDMILECSHLCHLNIPDIKQIHPT